MDIPPSAQPKKTPLRRPNRKMKPRSHSRRKIFSTPVNAVHTAGVVDTYQELFRMNTTAILSAWPDDERDRKRAPSRL